MYRDNDSFNIDTFAPFKFTNFVGSYVINIKNQYNINIRYIIEQIMKKFPVQLKLVK